MSLKAHEVLRLWRLPETPAPAGEDEGIGLRSVASSSTDAFELVLDPACTFTPAAPAATRTLRPQLVSPERLVEVSVGDSIQSIIAELKSQGVTETDAELMRRARFHEPGIDLDRLRVGTVLCFEAATTPRAPTQAELVKSPIVRDAVESAWLDSKVDDPNARHEEGGWIYMNIATGQVFVHRAPSGSLAGLDLRTPVAYVDAVVVGTFHTHPNALTDNYVLGPSDSDRNWDYSRGVPGIVRSSMGYHTYGWERRRMDLEGPWAYPGTPENDLSGDPGPARSPP